MKKNYIAPAVEIDETEMSQMIALSLQEGSADDSAVLVNEENSDDETWEIW